MIGAHPMHADIRFDDGRHPRARIGFVLLAMEQTIESDMVRHVPAGVGVHFTRSAMSNNVTSENLAAMHAGLAPAAALLLPGAGLDVVCYACTSGSVVMGEGRVCEALKEGCPEAVATTLVSGVFAALDAVGAKRVVVATPYLDEVNAIERDYMIARGVGVLDIQGLNIAHDTDMVRVTPDYIRDFAISVDDPDADAIFISCGALRATEIIDAVEAATGKPCITSNQAMLWHCLRLAGVEDRLAGLGQLLREH